MIILDHTEPNFTAKQFRPNGAEKYSRDLVAHDVPIWKSLCGDADDVVISTCNRLNRVHELNFTPGKEYALAVQYLHTFPKENAVEYVQQIISEAPFSSRRMIFISAYTSYVSLLRAAGIEAYYLPMFINPQQVLNAVKGMPQQDKSARGIIWFGNVYTAKKETFRRIKVALERAGFELHYISEGKYYHPFGLPGIGDTVTQERAWQIISTFRYGIGVGRCALEMMSLGLRVMIAGDSFGGIVTNEAEYLAQQQVNFNSRVCTFDNNMYNCVMAMLHLPEDEYKLIRPYPDMERRATVIKHITEKVRGYELAG